MLAVGYSLLALSSAAQVDAGQTQRLPVSQKSEDFVFDVQPRVIAPGETAVLRWSIKGATKVVIEEVPDSRRDLQKLGTFGSTGSMGVRPREGTTYVLSCEGSATYFCASITVHVRIKRVVSPRRPTE